jgi:hypothetical protein
MGTMYCVFFLDVELEPDAAGARVGYSELVKLAEFLEQ